MAGVQRGLLRSLLVVLAGVVLVLTLGCGEPGPGLFPFSNEELQSEFDQLEDLKTRIDAAREQGCRKSLGESGIDVDRYRADLVRHLERRDYEEARDIYRGMHTEVWQYEAKARDAGCPLIAGG